MVDKSIYEPVVDLLGSCKFSKPIGSSICSFLQFLVQMNMGFRLSTLSSPIDLHLCLRSLPDNLPLLSPLGYFHLDLTTDR